MVLLHSPPSRLHSPGFHLSGTVTAPKSSSGSPLPPSSSSGAVGGGGGAAGGGVGVAGGTAAGAGPPVETEKKYRVSVSFDRYDHVQHLTLISLSLYFFLLLIIAIFFFSFRILGVSFFRSSFSVGSHSLPDGCPRCHSRSTKTAGVRSRR